MKPKIYAVLLRENKTGALGILKVLAYTAFDASVQAKIDCATTITDEMLGDHAQYYANEAKKPIEATLVSVSPSLSQIECIEAPYGPGMILSVNRSRLYNDFANKRNLPALLQHRGEVTEREMAHYA